MVVTKEGGSGSATSPAPKLGQLLPYELWGLTLFPGQWEGQPGILNCSSYKRPQPAPLTPGHSKRRVGCLAASSTSRLPQGSSWRKAPSPRGSPKTMEAEWAPRLTVQLNGPLFRKCAQEGTMLRFHYVFKGERRSKICK